MNGIEVAALAAALVALAAMTGAVVLARRHQRRGPAHRAAGDLERPGGDIPWPAALAVVGALALVAAMLLATIAVFSAALPEAIGLPAPPL